MTETNFNVEYTDAGDVIITPKPYDSVTEKQIKKKRVKFVNGKNTVEEYDVNNVGTMCTIEQKFKTKVVRVSDKASQTDNSNWSGVNSTPLSYPASTWPAAHNVPPSSANQANTWPTINNVPSSTNPTNTWPATNPGQSLPTNPASTWPAVNNLSPSTNPTGTWPAVNNANQLPAVSPSLPNMRGKILAY